MPREERYCYLRNERLRDLVTTDRVLDALVHQLGVPGKASTLKGLSSIEKLNALVEHIKYEANSPISRWHKVDPYEVLAANIYEAEKLPSTLVKTAFSCVKAEKDLATPVMRWLKQAGFDDVYKEVPMGTKRADVLGYKKGGFFRSELLVAIELKNEGNQMKRALDQLVVFREYSHQVYLACTPFVAAEEVQRHADGKGVKHWDAGVFDRKLIDTGFGLLLVEGDQVTDHIGPRASNPNASKIVEIKEQLAKLPRY